MGLSSGCLPLLVFHWIMSLKFPVCGLSPSRHQLPNTFHLLFVSTKNSTYEMVDLTRYQKINIKICLNQLCCSHADRFGFICPGFEISVSQSPALSNSGNYSLFCAHSIENSICSFPEVNLENSFILNDGLENTSENSSVRSVVILLSICSQLPGVGGTLKHF